MYVVANSEHVRSHLSKNTQVSSINSRMSMNIRIRYLFDKPKTTPGASSFFTRQRLPSQRFAC